jgi:hypothetical protein
MKMMNEFARFLVAWLILRTKTSKITLLMASRVNEINAIKPSVTNNVTLLSSFPPR